MGGDGHGEADSMAVTDQEARQPAPEAGGDTPARPADGATDSPTLQVRTAVGPRLEPLRLGERIRAIRRDHRWTLEEASRKTGLARSTLSKIENGQMSPTFEAVQKLVIGLGIDIPQLFQPTAPPSSPGRRAVSRAGKGRAHPTATYEHELLCTALTNKRMIPFKSRIRARSFDDFPGWVRHEGEEFLLVLEGCITLYTEYYEPLKLDAGDCVYYDSGMGHACVSESVEDALILWVTAS
jgi:transcriptional regulator with XRE-family HTH domain